MDFKNIHSLFGVECLFFEGTGSPERKLGVYFIRGQHYMVVFLCSGLSSCKLAGPFSGGRGSPILRQAPFF